MLEAACPNCGALLRFRSADLPIKVCDHCRSSILRGRESLQAMGRIAEVPEDVSPLQLGTRGRDGGQGFELVGRVRWRWSDGAWNEWLALFDDGSTGWLGEAMGRLMLLRPLDPGFTNKLVKLLKEDRKVEIGSHSTIDQVLYTVTDVKDVTCIGGEGELPSSTPAGLAMRSVDLMAEHGRCASVQRDRGDVLAYAGRYVSLADLAATNLRAFEGWPMPTYAA
jgi:hypothetical protein